MRSVRRWIWAIVAAVAVATVVLLVRRVPDVAPQSDFAIIDVQVLNALHGGQALGQPSRFGWSHPGPLYFQVLAPLYLLTGYRHVSTLATATAINIAAIVAVLLLMRRYATDGGLFAATAILLTVFVWRAWGLLSSPWNPHVPILPLAGLIAVAAVVVSGRLRAAPWAVVLASFVVQAHVGFALSAAAILVLMVALSLPAWVRDWRVDRERRELVRAATWSVAAGLVLWAWPLIDELRPGGRHNLAQIASFFRDQMPGDPRVLGRAFAESFIAPFSRTLGLPWGHEYWPGRDPPVEVTAQLQGVMLIVAAWWMRRRPFERAFSLVLIAASAAAFVSVRRLPPHPNDHAVYWVSVLGVMSWAVIAAAPLGRVLAWMTRRLSIAPQAASGAAIALTAAFLTITGYRQVVEGRRDVERSEWQVTRTVALVRGAMARTVVPRPLIHVPQDFWELAAGAILQLERSGVVPAVDPGWVRVFGPATQPAGPPVLEILLVKESDHRDDYQHRSNHEALGAVLGTYVYAIHPPPPTIALGAPPEIVAAAGSAVLDTARLTDGRWLLDRAGALPPMTIFAGTSSSVTLRVPDRPVIGLRVWGQQSVSWQLACSVDGARFEPFGRVRTPDGDEPLAGDVLLRDLGRCRLLRIQPYDNSSAWSLSELQWLAPPTAR